MAMLNNQRVHMVLSDKIGILWEYHENFHGNVKVERCNGVQSS
jgi:hypothetical protein